MPIALENRITQSDQELHVGLEVPRHTARQIFLWAQKQEWPEGTELEAPSEYHVTLLYTPSGYDEHKDAWWLEHMEEVEVRIKGFTSFGPTDDGYAYVLLLDAPEVKEHAEVLQNRAEAMGLEITHFPGGYKPHLTVGYGPTRVPKIKTPEFQFHVGPSSVSAPRLDVDQEDSGEGSDESHTSGARYDTADNPTFSRYWSAGADHRSGTSGEVHWDNTRLWAPSISMDPAVRHARGSDSESSSSGQPTRWHHNPWTGLPCDCGWGAPRGHRTASVHLSGVEARKLLKAPDKAWRTPKGDAFRQHLAQLPEHYDPLLPYLAQRYKKGDVRLQGEPGPEGRLKYISRYTDPRYRVPAREGPAAPDWQPLHEHRFEQWLQWYNARQHPTRRGINVMDPNFTPRDMAASVGQHQAALEEERQRERWLGQYAPHAEPHHVFGPEMYEGFVDPESEEAKKFASKYWGWQVVPLDEYQAEGDSQAMGHCIGRDSQPYKHNIAAGNIDAYSLRDREGYPHTSWHINPSGDSIGHMQGKSGYPNPEYRQLISMFNNAHGLPDEEGGEEELEDPEDPYFTFPQATDMDDYVSYHHPDYYYDYAFEHGNIGENTQLDWERPRWDSIASDYLNSGGPNNEFHAALKDQYDWDPMHSALLNEMVQDDEDHRKALSYWNDEAPSQYEIEIKPPPANEVDKYNEIHGDGSFSPEPDDWDELARDYLGYYENYSKPGWQGNTEYQDFHNNLKENQHGNFMRDSLMRNIDWEDPEHQWAAQTWNYGMPQHNIHPPSESPPEVSPNQIGFQWSPVRQNWEDPTLGIGDRLRQYTEHPEYKTWNPNGNGTFSRVAYDPDHVEAEDSPSLQSVARQLHYHYEQTGSLNAEDATAYATRILQMLGYPTDQITLQAALQAWQTEYPDDRVLLSPTPPSNPGMGMLESGNGFNPGIQQWQQNPGGSELRGSVRGAGQEHHRGEELHDLGTEWGAGAGLHRQVDQGTGGGQEDAVGLLAGHRGGTRTAQIGQVSPELQSIIDAFGKQYGLTLLADESPSGVSFDTIEVPPSSRGTGAGTRMMHQLKSYCDRHGKPMTVQHVVNYPFFERFNWLNQTGGDEFSYQPMDHSTVPTQVNSPLDHWPEWGEQPPDQHRDIEFSNDWAWHQGNYCHIRNDGRYPSTSNNTL